LKTYLILGPKKTEQSTESIESQREDQRKARSEKLDDQGEERRHEGREERSGHG
jgi:hypothetical protein